MSDTVYDSNKKPIGEIRNGNLVWTCDQYKCTWINPDIAGAVKKKKQRNPYDYSVSRMFGGLG